MDRQVLLVVVQEVVVQQVVPQMDFLDLDPAEGIVVVHQFRMDLTYPVSVVLLVVVQQGHRMGWRHHIPEEQPVLEPEEIRWGRRTELGLVREHRGCFGLLLEQ